MEESSLRLVVRPLSECPECVSVVTQWHWDAWGIGSIDTTQSEWELVVASRAERDAVPFTLVGFVDGVPVGAVSACRADADGRFDGNGPWLSGMVVRSDARNLGIGRALLARVEDRCGQLGYLSIWLHTSEAKRFYERCGWQLEADKTSIGPDAVLSKKLGEHLSQSGPPHIEPNRVASQWAVAAGRAGLTKVAGSVIRQARCQSVSLTKMILTAGSIMASAASANALVRVMMAAGSRRPSATRASTGSVVLRAWTRPIS